MKRGNENGRGSIGRDDATDDRMDDPRLTAYALDELEREERLEVRARLARDPELAHEVKAMAELGAWLERELGTNEARDGLGVERRARLEGPGAEEEPAARAVRRRPVLAAKLAVAFLSAASMLVVCGSIWWVWDASHVAPSPYTYHVFEGGADSSSFDPELLQELSPFAYVGDDGDGSVAQVPSALRELGYGGGQPSRANRARATGRPQDALTALDALGHVDSHDEGPTREGYAHIAENPFRAVAVDPLSTFSVDVDTASYANVRRFLNEGRLPPADAVRIEELVNYFPYDDPAPLGPEPFATRVEVAGCPWAPEHRIVRIGLKGAAVAGLPRVPKNLVFLLDVSGSMNDPLKLPLLVRSMHLLVENLAFEDRVAIVVYAGASGLVLPSTSVDSKHLILAALDELSAGGSTNGGAGIELAYRVARENFVAGGVNRVVLATDGDFNVGVTDDGSLVRLIEEQAKSGVFLSVLGFGRGNLQDAKMEQLADHGNGNYAYVDSLHEARKVLVREIGGTLRTIAKDVKIQVEFNPAQVAAFRLIGYENRLLAHEDFNDDRRDAGEIGAGHSVTALYEIVPAGVDFPRRGVDPLEYQAPREDTARPSASDELLTVKLRYKDPEGSRSRLIEVPVIDPGTAFADASSDLRWASAVAAFGMCLRDSAHRGDATLSAVHEWAFAAAGSDPFGYRQELLRLVASAERLAH